MKNLYYIVQISEKVVHISPLYKLTPVRIEDPCCDSLTAHRITARCNSGELTLQSGPHSQLLWTRHTYHATGKQAIAERQQALGSKLGRWRYSIA